MFIDPKLLEPYHSRVIVRTFIRTLRSQRRHKKDPVETPLTAHNLAKRSRDIVALNDVSCSGPNGATSRLSAALAGKMLLVTVVVALSACNPGAEEARTLQALCGDGDAGACNDLGYRAFRGEHILRDWRRAADLFQHACDGGEAEGCVRLGRLHVNDASGRHGVTRDSTLAANLYQQGCDGGAMPGCIYLGDMYLERDTIIQDVEPQGVTQDLARGASLFQQACEGGEMPGCTKLGVSYQEGLGVVQDLARAASLYQEACDGDAALGCSHLGELYAAGAGVAQDLNRAATLYEEACDVEMVGCFNLGDLFARGSGVTRDYDRAVELFQQACDGTMNRGEGSAPIAEGCFRVGDLYATGTGVAWNLSRASRLFRRACRLGYEEACRRR